MNTATIYIGWDPREELAWRVAHRTLLRHMSEFMPVKKLVLHELIELGMYRRPMRKREDGRLIDPISATADYDGSMSTEHANARFFVPMLERRTLVNPDHGHWALFCDGDVLFRDDICKVFDGLDPYKALYCVKHAHKPKARKKMDGCAQTIYRRKNWSSFMLFNMQHPAHRRLTLANLNTLPGRDLHGFYWLFDEEIGALDPKWNHLVGYSVANGEPAMVHFTEGVPNMPGYERCDYAQEWWDEAREIETHERDLAVAG